MKFLSTIFLYLFLNTFLFSQTILYDDPLGNAYSNIDEVQIDLTPLVDISNCTSIQFSVDFSFSLPWEGSGGMETSDECNFGLGCPGDPEDPLFGDCPVCWDFMWMLFMVDGDVVDEELIGEAGTDDSEQFGSYSFEYCVEEGDSEANIEFQNMNWTNSETNSYFNVTIICWEKPEIDTNSPICGTQNLTLDGSVPGTDAPTSWEWTSDGPADIDDDSAQNTFAEDAIDGEEFTLTITDINGCEGSETVAVAAGGFDVDVDGGGEFCGCTSDDTDLEIDISGGSPLYTITINVEGIGNIDLPTTDISGIYRICSTTDFIPDIDDSAEPIQIIIPEFFFPLDIEVVSVVDDTGCSGVVNGGVISFELEDAPEINQPQTPTYCIGSDGLVDLTIMDDEITGGSGFDVLWFEDEELEDQISNPSAYDVFDGNTVYAVVNDGTCNSETIEVGLNFNLQPEFTIIESIIVDCGDNPYFLPAIGDIVTVENGLLPAYYLESGGIDGPVNNIDPNEVTSIFIYDGSISGCEAEVEIPLSITPNPIINSPLMTLGGCGQLELPEPELDFAISYEYNTQEDGTGDTFFAGDIITSALNGITLYLIATGDNNCTDIEELEIVLSNSLSYSADVVSPLCDSLILPPIVPTTGAVAYYSATQGMGTQFQPGDIIFAPFTGSLFIFDPTVDPVCASEDTLMLNITIGPQPIFPADTSACEFLVLPELGSLTGPNIRYSTFAVNLSSSNLYPGDTVFFDQLLFVHDTIGQCILLDSMIVNINVPLFVGRDTSIIICEGFTTPFDFMDLLTNPVEGGTWQYPTVPDFSPTDSTELDLSVFPVGQYDFIYGLENQDCGLQTSTITVDVVTPPNGGENNFIDTCVGGQLFDFMALIGNPDTGGIWQQVNGPDVVDLTDTTAVLLNGLTPDDYAFLYIIEGDATSEFCEAESSSLFITISPGVNAGSDAALTSCIGEEIDFTNLISSDAATNGMLEGDGLVFTGSTWNTSTANPGETYNINYIVNSNNISCPNDTAIFTIDLVDLLSAGNPVSDLMVCEGQPIQISDYLETQSIGGSFFLQSDLTTEITNGEWNVALNEDIAYIVEGISGCPSDTAIISFDITPQAQFGITSSGLSICSDDDNNIELSIANILGIDFDFELTLTEQLTGTVLFTGNITDVGTTLILEPSEPQYTLSNDTLYIGNTPGVYDLSIAAFTGSLNCPSENIELISFQIIESYTETIDTSLCDGQIFEFRGIEYTSSEEVIIPSLTNACDSLFILNLDFLTSTSGSVEGVFCIGDVVDVLGTIFSRDTLLTETFQGMSVNGCDSIVDIDVSFQNVAVGIVNPTLCASETLTVEGQVFDINNTSDDILLANGSVAGCDSLIDVDIIFLTGIEFDLRQNICPGESVIVGPDTYDASNLMGSTTLTGLAVSGCDSIVNIDLTLLTESTTLINDALCFGVSIESNGTTYDESNAIGQEILTNAIGCDSIVNIDLQFSSGGESNFEDAICEGESIVIGPDTYNMDNLTGVTILTGMSSNSCDSTVNVTISLLQTSIENFTMVLCPGESVTIDGDVYDETNLSGTSILSGQSLNGCDSIVNVSLEYDAPMADITSIMICEGELSGTATIISVDALNFPITLTINNSIMETVNTLPYSFDLPLGINTVTLNDVNNCMYEQMVEITSVSLGSLSITSNLISINTYRLNLESDFPIVDITWSPSSGLSCNACDSPTATITANTTYDVLVESNLGCIVLESIMLEYMEPPMVSEFYVANTFDISNPPNDNFYIQSNDANAVVKEMRVFDRWGNLVFLIQNVPVNDSSQGWDGTMNGSPLVQGVYVYTATIVTEEGEQQIWGDVTLLK